MKKVWAMALVVGMTVTGLAGLVRAETVGDQEAPVAASALSDAVKAKLDVVKANRQETQVLHEQIEAQNQTNKELWAKITGEKKGLKGQREGLVGAAKEEWATAKAGMADLREKAVAAREAKDKEALQALRSEWEQFQAGTKAAREGLKAEMAALKAEAEALKAKRAELQDELDTLKALRDQAEGLRNEIGALRERGKAAAGEARAALEAKDEAAAIAALDEVISLQAQGMEKGRQLLAVKQQIEAVLQQVLAQI